MTPELKQRIEQIKNGEVPEGYVYTKVGILPKWECAHISQIAEAIIDKVGNGTYETLSISAGIGFVNQAKKFGKELSGKQYEKYTVLKHGDFSYNKGNSKTYPQGCIYRLKDRETAAVPNVFESFTIKKGNSDYYEQLFVSGFLNKQLSTKINHGVRDDGLLNLTGKDFYSCYVPVPPLEEQQKIAEPLMQCDKVIELKKKRIEEEKKLKKWLMEKLLNPDSGVRLSGFKGEWKQKRLGDICQITTGKLDSNAMDKNGKYPFFTCAKEMFYINNYAFDTEAILISGNGANVGYVHYYNGKFNAYQRTYVLDKFEEEIFYIKMYLEQSLEKRIAVEKNSGNTPYIVLSTLSKMNILFPNKEEQKKIAEVLVAKDNEIYQLGQELEQWQQKKKALMQLLLTGSVRCNL